MKNHKNKNTRRACGGEAQTRLIDGFGVVQRDGEIDEDHVEDILCKLMSIMPMGQFTGIYAKALRRMGK